MQQKKKARKNHTKILISACLIGEDTRYNGKIISIESDKLDQLKNLAQLIPVCPEVEGGLSVPRNPAELTIPIEHILVKQSGILNQKGVDVTKYFLSGIKLIMQRIDLSSICMAILKEYSPSCGVSRVYDGSFNGRKIQGNGLFTHYLLNKGIPVFSEKKIEDAIEYLRSVQLM